MYAEFDQLSIFRMSKNDESEEAKFNIIKRPALEIREQVTAHEDKSEGKCRAKTVISDELRKPTLGEIKVTNDDDGDHDDDDNNDGFITPTSLDHKIPVVTQCPPAPRKPKLPPSRSISSPSRKRKASLIRILDFSKEVESLFAPPDIFATISRKIKKTRDDITDH